MEQTTRASTAHVVDGAARRARGGPILWGTVAVAAIVVALLAYAVLRPAQNSPAAVGHRPAPPFTITRYDNGKPLRLSDLRGKTVVLNFWYSNCQPCQQEAPVLEQAWRQWQSRGVVFVGIDEVNSEPSQSAPRDFIRSYGVSYPNGADPSDLNIQYFTTGQPETFFISPKGIIKSKYMLPFTDPAQLAPYIRGARS